MATPPIKVPAPAQPRANPYLPTAVPEPLVFEEFAGINTSTTRPGVDPKQMFWCDGMMPIGKNYLRSLFGVGSPIDLSAYATVSFFGFANIGEDAYAITIHSDGSIRASNTTTYVSTQIATSGTIEDPSRLNNGLSQYGSVYVVIVAAQDDGYFLWDGTVFFQAGGLSPVVTLTDGGSGYTSATATFSGGSGTGATADVTVSGGSVTSITITNPGTGYLATDTPHITISLPQSGSDRAAATLELMPFAVRGTNVETYAARVWIVDGDVLTFSAPGSVTDFSSASGGGDVTSADSFLRVRYIALIQTNGFLYTVADSSLNYISGVTTSGDPPVTSFSNQNADPEVGSPWPSTVGTLGRNILFANAFGVHASYGAQVVKISDPLDGVYNTVADFAGLIPSTAKAIIFGKKVWMLLLPIVDPVSKQQVNKLLMWNDQTKRWWSSEQDVDLIYIQSQEINSILTAWGTDGSKLYPLFQTPSVHFSKTVQSRLWMTAGQLFVKAANRLWSMVQYNSINNPAINVSIDNEFGSSRLPIQVTPNTMNWKTVDGDVMNWKTINGAVMIWYVAGISAAAPQPVGQAGVLIGLTIQTNCDDVVYIQFAIAESIASYRG